MKCKKCNENTKLYDFKCKKCNEYQYLNIFICVFIGLWLLGIGVFQDGHDFTISDFMTSIFASFFKIAIGYVYWIPTLVAIYRKHNNKIAIGCINTFLGWTLVGWVVSLVWALANPTVNKNVEKEKTTVEKTTPKKENIDINKYDQLEKIAKLKENNIITEEEFEKEKKKILEQ